MKFERRMATEKVEVRGAEGEARTIVGYGGVFNRETVIRDKDGSSFREVILPGAFQSVVAAGGDLTSLYNHDPNFVLGRTTAGTLTVSEDATGLRYEVTPPASRQDVIDSVQRGDVTGSSFGFKVAKGGDTWTRPTKAGDLALRTISAFETVRDVGPVTFPAFDETTAEVRSAADAATRAAATPADDPLTPEETALVAACQTCADACAACVTAGAALVADPDQGSTARDIVSAAASMLQACGRAMAKAQGQNLYGCYASSDIPTLRARLDLEETANG